MVTMSNIAYTVSVIKNSYKVWDAEHKEKEKGKEGDSVIAGGHQIRQKTTVKSKFTSQGGKKRQCNKPGWKNEGIEFYKKVHACWHELSGKSEYYDTWTMLHDAWTTYEEKTNFGQSRRRKKHIHKETAKNFDERGEDCPPLPVWGTEC